MKSVKVSTETFLRMEVVRLELLKRNISTTKGEIILVAMNTLLTKLDGQNARG